MNKAGFDDLLEILTSPFDMGNALLIVVLVGPLTSFYFKFAPFETGLPFITLVGQFAVLCYLFVFADDSEKAIARRLKLSFLLLIAALIWFFIMLRYSSEVSGLGLVIAHSYPDNDRSFLRLMLDLSWVFMFVTLASFLGTIAKMRTRY